MTENARKTNFLATVLQIMTGIAVRTDHKLQGYVELTDIEKSASVLKRWVKQFIVYIYLGSVVGKEYLAHK